VRERRNWRYWLDELFLSPRWGLVAAWLRSRLVLFVVFGVSAWLDALTSRGSWNGVTLATAKHHGRDRRAVADGLIGLVGIVVPYMIRWCCY